MRLLDFAFALLIVALDWPWTKLRPWRVFAVAWKLSGDTQHLHDLNEGEFIHGVETYLAIRIAEEVDRQRAT